MVVSLCGSGLFVTLMFLLAVASPGDKLVTFERNGTVVKPLWVPREPAPAGVDERANAIVAVTRPHIAKMRAAG
jgi:hypothetical protein